jgi:mono/diheme cytochrome c family protein
VFGRIALAVLVIIAVLCGGFAAFAHRPSIAPIAPPAASTFSPELIARGELLSGAGYCSSCHTAQGGKPYAGGYAIRTVFGTIYSSNITPDPGTGIGTWSEAAFERAMREGVARDGAHLFPAFPYDHFTKLTDADVQALYAYFMTREPVVALPPPNTLPFPLSLRPLQAGWKLLFFEPGRFVADARRSAEWNEGAYLAEGISHCGACHTPRNALGAEKKGALYAGADIDGWIAPPLTRANPSPVAWDAAELAAYLRSGVSGLHGTAVGPMSPVVHDGLIKLPDSDIGAIAAYFADVGQAAAKVPATQAAADVGQAAAKVPATQAAAVPRALGREQIDRSRMRTFDAPARLYVTACASCHYNRDTVNPLRPDLALVSAVSLREPTNLIRVVLGGVSAEEGAPGVVMPAFGSGFSNADIAMLAAYLRATRTDLPPWPNLDKTVAALRRPDSPPKPSP